MFHDGTLPPLATALATLANAMGRPSHRPSLPIAKHSTQLHRSRWLRQGIHYSPAPVRSGLYPFTDTT